MIKTLMASTLALLLVAAAPTSAQTLSGGPISTGQQALVGTLGGAWNTPFSLDAAPGFAAGVLRLGVPQFFMDAVVLPAPSPQGSGIQGILDGTLMPFPLSPIADPFAVVTGSWTYDQATETGSFQALIITPPTPFTGGVPQILLGRLGGQFKDPFTPVGPDVLGSFSGRWVLDLL